MTRNKNKTMSNQNIFFLGIIVIVLFSSCESTQHAFFVQHEANTLKLKKEKDIIVTGGALTSNNVSYLGSNENATRHRRFGIQAAYSPIKHLGIFGVHSRLKLSDPNSPSITYHKSHVTGGGVGTYYYFKFHQRPAHKVLPGRAIKYTKILFDLYGGYTYGKLENEYFFPPADAVMNYQKFYLQGGIHWEGTFWSFSYVHKWGRTNFLNGVINGQTDRRDDAALLAILNKNNLFFQEGSLRMEVKNHGLGLYGQLTAAGIQDFNFRSIPNSIVHFGVVVNINDVREHFFKNRTKPEINEKL